MHIDIPDHLNRRLEQLAKGTGQDVSALVCEAIEQRLASKSGSNVSKGPRRGSPFLTRTPLCR